MAKASSGMAGFPSNSGKWICVFQDFLDSVVIISTFQNNFKFIRSFYVIYSFNNGSRQVRYLQQDRLQSRGGQGHRQSLPQMVLQV